MKTKRNENINGVASEEIAGERKRRHNRPGVMVAIIIAGHGVISERRGGVSRRIMKSKMAATGRRGGGVIGENAMAGNEQRVNAWRESTAWRQHGIKAKAASASAAASAA
jgi:hypothetical protein